MQRRANRLLVWTIVSTAFEEVAVAAAVLWLLPEFGIRVSPWILAPVMPAMAVYAVFTYRRGIKALRTEPIPGMTSMVGIEGEVVRDLSPTGTVKVRGELWTARAAAGSLIEGRRVVVIDQERLKLVVRAVDGASGAPVGHVDSN